MSRKSSRALVIASSKSHWCASRTLLRQFRRFARDLRERLPSAIIVAGGPHATACPAHTLQSCPEVGFVLRGEADESLCELGRQLDRNRAEPDVPGLCSRADGREILRDQASPPNDLNLLPIPDRGFLLENYRRGVYWRIGRRGTADLVVTSRGCPFDCKFCFKLSSHYRARNPENVVQELEMLASLGITAIDIEDDLFTANKARCVAICRGIRAAGPRLDLKVRSHVKTIDTELIAELRAAGVSAVVFGIESGSSAVLKAMNKKATVEDNRRAIHMVKKAGLQCIADMILGHPGETLETIDETKRFLRETRPTVIHLSLLCPFPETKVYLEAKKAGTLAGDWDQEGTWPHIVLPELKDQDLLHRKWVEVQRAFYKDPRVILNVLRHNALKMNLRDWRAALSYMNAKVGHRAGRRRRAPRAVGGMGGNRTAASAD